MIQAKNFTATNGRKITTLVIHDVESPEGDQTAENVARYFANQPKSDNGSSAHECVDNNSVVQCVLDKDIAWAAPGLNSVGWHLELAGYAKQSRAEWLDAYGEKMLPLAAGRLSAKSHEYNIPLTYLTADRLRRGERLGITTHNEITRSGIGKGNHTDPGPGFPIDYIMDLIGGAKTPGGLYAPLPQSGIVVDGDFGGETIRALQTSLNNSGANPRLKVDGDFGDLTKKALQRRLNHTNGPVKDDGDIGQLTIKALQRHVGAKDDGDWGPATTRKLQEALNANRF